MLGSHHPRLLLLLLLLLRLLLLLHALPLPLLVLLLLRLLLLLLLLHPLLLLLLLHPPLLLLLPVQLLLPEAVTVEVLGLRPFVTGSGDMLLHFLVPWGRHLSLRASRRPCFTTLARRYSFRSTHSS